MFVLYVVILRKDQGTANVVNYAIRSAKNAQASSSKWYTLSFCITNLVKACARCFVALLPSSISVVKASLSESVQNIL